MCLNLFFREQVQFESIIRHSNMSRAEGYPTTIRIITPSDIVFALSDNFDTNYTLSNSVATATMDPLPNATDPVTKRVDITFPSLTYVDIVELNFTLTVAEGRPIGSGDETTNVVLAPVCEQNVIDSYPVTAGDLAYCGDLVQIPVMTSAPGERVHLRHRFLLFTACFFFARML